MTAFEAAWQQRAGPIDWRYTRRALAHLLDRLDERHHPSHARPHVPTWPTTRSSRRSPSSDGKRRVQPRQHEWSDPLTMWVTNRRRIVRADVLARPNRSEATSGISIVREV